MLTADLIRHLGHRHHVAMTGEIEATARRIMAHPKRYGLLDTGGALEASRAHAAALARELERLEAHFDALPEYDID